MLILLKVMNCLSTERRVGSRDPLSQIQNNGSEFRKDTEIGTDEGWLKGRERTSGRAAKAVDRIPCNGQVVDPAKAATSGFNVNLQLY
jgi:hypothetical protein